MTALATRKPKQHSAIRQEVDRYVATCVRKRACVGVLERAACRRYLDDRSQWRTKNSRFHFNEALATNACQFFPMFLSHTDGEYAGTPFTLKPWQLFVVWNLWGWRRPNGFRRFREAFVSLGRGNGKTPFGAGLGLLAFAMDSPPEPRAECYSAAVKRDQAKLSFDAAKRFVEKNPWLKDKIEVLKHNLNLPGNQSKFEPLSSDGKSADGLNIHFVLRDELHAWTEPYRDFYEKLQTALGKRRQPLAVTITTAGTDQSLIWREQYEFARKVVTRDNGVESDELFVLICEIDDDDDELDETCWPKANPMMAHGIVKIDHIRQMAAKAKEDPGVRHQLRRYHCNKLTTSFNRCFEPAHIVRAMSQSVPEQPFSHTPHAAVDLGWKDDLAAIGYCFPLDTVEIDNTLKRRYWLESDVFIPAGSKRHIDRPPWSEWIRSGVLHVTQSDWTDTQSLYGKLEERIREHGIATLAYDPNNAREFALNCVNVLGIQTFPFVQAHKKYNEPLQELVIALSEGRIGFNNPLLAWAFQNVVEEVDSRGNRMPAKARSLEKIDPAVACLMAFSEALFAERDGPSVLESRGPLVMDWSEIENMARDEVYA